MELHRALKVSSDQRRRGGETERATGAQRWAAAVGTEREAFSSDFRRTGKILRQAKKKKWHDPAKVAAEAGGH